MPAARNRTVGAGALAAAAIGLAACSPHTDSSPTGTTGTAPTTSTSTAAAQKASTVLLTADERTALTKRRPSFAAIVRQCDSRRDYRAEPVGDLAIGRHYSSTGAHAPNQAAKHLEADSQAAYQLALCHLVTGSPADAGTAQRIIDAWSTTLKTASTISGKDDLAFFMTPMTVAASWVRGVNGWSGSSYATFLTKMGLPNTRVVMAHQHNHGLWGVWYQSSAAVYLADPGLLARTRQRWQTLMEQETAPDGTMTNEVQRSGTSDYTGGADKGVKGLAYTNYALLPATLAAKTFADQGTPVWGTPGGTLLGKAYAKAAGWILDPRTFPYYASNHGRLDTTTRASYAAILQQHFPQADGARLLRDKKITGDSYYLLRLFPQP